MSCCFEERSSFVQLHFQTDPFAINPRKKARKTRQEKKITARKERNNMQQKKTRKAMQEEKASRNKTRRKKQEKHVETSHQRQNSHHQSCLDRVISQTVIFFPSPAAFATSSFAILSIKSCLIPEQFSFRSTSSLFNASMLFIESSLVRFCNKTSFFPDTPSPLLRDSTRS